MVAHVFRKNAEENMYGHVAMTDFNTQITAGVHKCIQLLVSPGGRKQANLAFLPVLNP
jgi:hypothetical protein